ncbi:hypothetical protein Spith_0270 [Spirochaeta thermophila DSM 6578]|uniref:Uncharacterized protein n=1 Tax=Winmispira thermophila (strain ATCC 700085 / DSM 6578 / Z-1203) TaxID=869211 RepID=G0GDD0_WINT7|nr:hypothetical protein [Spirochaeta thermophila]AEJ60556.1 hypothetical protein Spith_0270 [Spirochaeta thermophila DSM 6578]
MKGRARGYSAFLVAGLLLVVGAEGGCSYGFLQESKVEISGVSDGEVISRPGVSVLVVVESAEEETSPPKPEREISIELLRIDGDLLLSSTQILPENDEHQWALDVEFPDDMEEGWYRLRVVYLENGVRGEEIERWIFYASSPEDYGILRIEAHPSLARPKAEVLVEGRVRLPENAEAWIRWKAGEKVVQEGWYSEGAQVLRWQVPEQEGAYTLTMELFPLWSEKAYPEFSSSFRSSGSIVVGEVEALPGELGPNADYLFLYHFRGDFVNDGSAGDEPDETALQVEGKPLLSYEDGTLGYLIEGDSRVVFPIPSSLHSSSWKFEMRGLVKAAPEGDDRAPFVLVEGSGARLEVWGGEGTLVLRLRDPSGTNDLARLTMAGSSLVLGFTYSTGDYVVSLEGSEEVKARVPGFRPRRVVLQDGGTRFLVDELGLRMENSSHSSAETP